MVSGSTFKDFDNYTRCCDGIITYGKEVKRINHLHITNTNEKYYRTPDEEVVPLPKFRGGPCQKNTIKQSQTFLFCPCFF